MLYCSIASKDDVSQIVEIHNEAFKDFFLTSLGSTFLSTYYRSVRRNSHGILLICKSDNKIVGFCAATLNSKGFSTSLVIGDFFSYLMIVAKLLFSNPAALVRLYKNFSKKNKTIEDDGNYAELLSIGVLQSSQGQGVGKSLLQELEKEVRSKGRKRLSLTTDFYDNDRTLKFYKSLGYEVMYDFIAFPNRRMFRYIKNL